MLRTPARCRTVRALWLRAPGTPVLKDDKSRQERSLFGAAPGFSFEEPRGILTFSYFGERTDPRLFLYVVKQS